MADAPTDHQSQYGDVTYADPKNHKYPINSEARVRAAWSYINMPKNQKGYTPGEVASIKAKIKAAGKKYGIQFSDDGDSGGRSAVGDEIERRNTLLKVELRTVGGHGNGRDIGGYAAVFDKPSKNLGTYIEVVNRAFFNKSRADGWVGAGNGVVARYNHDDLHLLGTTQSGTLRLGIDDQGLDYTVDVPKHREDVLELVERGDIRQSSFAFKVIEQDWGQSEAGYTQRTLVSGLLIDVAPVTTPAYEDTSVGLRSLAAFKGIPEDEVFQLADQQELRKLFVRTDVDGGTPKRPMSGAKARAYMRGKRPFDPFAKRSIG